MANTGIMLDIVHYAFETDALAEKETNEAKQRMRRILYGQLYGRKYTWGDETASGGDFGTQEVASGTTSLTHKPYIPPTQVNAASVRPYGAALDAPLG